MTVSFYLAVKCTSINYVKFWFANAEPVWIGRMSV